VRGEGEEGAVEEQAARWGSRCRLLLLLSFFSLRWWDAIVEISGCSLSVSNEAPLVFKDQMICVVETKVSKVGLD
jgi:hypothetical protein